MNKQGERTTESLALRKAGGAYLKSIRHAAGLTQRDIAVALKMNYYTMIAQMEAGTARIPPDTYAAYAKVLGLDPVTFTSRLLAYYDPHVYKILFADKAPEDINSLSEAQAELQQLMADVSSKSDAEITKVSNILRACLA